jgi:hypothetical protein
MGFFIRSAGPRPAGEEADFLNILPKPCILRGFMIGPRLTAPERPRQRQTKYLSSACQP